MVCVGDYVQTITTPKYRGPTHQESRPIFTVASCTFSNDIPFPVIPDDKTWQGGYHKSWDSAIDEHVESDDVAWEHKIPQAVFRGAFRPSLVYSDRPRACKDWKYAGRGKLAFLGEQHPDYLNISIGGWYGDKDHNLDRMTPAELHHFRYMIYAEVVSLWSNRLFCNCLDLRRCLCNRQIVDSGLNLCLHRLYTLFLYGYSLTT